MPSKLAEFDAIIYKVQTLAAGGFRVSIDGTSQDIAQAAFLMPFADTPGELIRVTFERVKKNEQNNGNRRKSTKTYI